VPLSRTKPYSTRALPCSPSPVSCTHASQGRLSYCGVTQGPYFDAQPRSHPAIRVAHGAERWTGRHGPPWMPQGELLAPDLTTTNQAPSSSTQPPYNLPVSLVFLPTPPLRRSRSSSGSHRLPPPQATAEHLPTTSVSKNRAPVSPCPPPPLHRPRAPPEPPNSGEPRRPPSQVLHCIPFLLSRVLFVKSGPICNGDKSSTGLPVKPHLK
jgi:hypothetical protein